jgi:RimJ/RimL family protein N-acetyltransferase
MDIDAFELETPRLRLRPHRDQDADFMLALNADPEVTRHLPDGPLDDRAQALEIIAGLREQFRSRRIGRFIVVERDTGSPIGWCGLKWLEDVGAVDLGYRFLRQYWGKGYAAEAARACLDYGFNTLGFETVTARIMPSNERSLRLARKLGMRPDGEEIEEGVSYSVYRIDAVAFKAGLR